LLGLNFSARDESYWLRSLAQGLSALGDRAGAEQIMRTVKNKPVKKKAAVVK